jgi:hypothetical protein
MTICASLSVSLVRYDRYYMLDFASETRGQSLVHATNFGLDYSVSVARAIG